jgi:arylsulfatase A-like enzyme
MSNVNVLLVTFDQFRADMVGHPLVKAPNVDRLVADGVWFTNHYSQAAPCAPGRAALYTGMYQMNNRVIANGTPLDRRFDNIAHLARRAGYNPTLFGYTDQAIDPRSATGPGDPRLEVYSEILPGFDPVGWLPDSQEPWMTWLASLGYDVADDRLVELARESTRPAEHSLSTFLTNNFLSWLEAQDAPWFAHVSYLRPHPPYDAAGEFATMYDPADVGDGIAPGEHLHPLHELALGIPEAAAPADEAARRAMRAQYFGMVSEVDAQLGRIIDELQSSGQWDSTLVILCADHGEQLGDHGLKEKLGFFEESYHIPCVIHDPRHPVAFGTSVTAFTENVDIMATLATAMDQAIPIQCDGMPLDPFIEGTTPMHWRSSAHYEWDWRYLFLAGQEEFWPTSRFLAHQNLAVLRSGSAAYVHFGDGSWLCFDLAADPTWRTTTTDPAVVLPLAQEMLSWRQEHLERTWSEVLLAPGRPGRWPALPGS